MTSMNASNPADHGGPSVTAQIAKWLAIIGAVNWGLVGFFNWDLVRALLGNDPGTSASGASRAVYALVGLSGLALAALSPRRRALATGRPVSAER